METMQVIHIKKLLLSSACIKNPDEATILDFVAETVAGYIEECTVLDKHDSIALLQDSGLNLDEDDLDDLANTIELITKRAAGEDDEEEEEFVDDGSCELCERFVSRSFHHLVPKETHNRYLSKGKLPSNLESTGDLTRQWLNVHGLMVCRGCHNAIHNAERNEVLAEQYNTLERILEHPKIYAFAKYNSGQPCRVRVRRGADKK